LDKNSKKIGMKFLVVEGVDGSGKSTQIRMIMDYFEQRNLPYRYIHFPRTEAPFYGEMVARFLRGDFGSIDRVDPYLVAMLYAGDRRDAASELREWLNQGIIVLLDRYVYSNIAFQCAKISDPAAQAALRDWILELEFTHHAIPRPAINILLDVPFSFTKGKLEGGRTGQEREYLRGLRDIHEEDLDFQQRVRNMYLWQAASCDDLKVIDCNDAQGGMLPPGAVFSKIQSVIQPIIS
jgi:dTMP kinase